MSTMMSTTPSWNALIVRGDRKFVEIEDQETGDPVTIPVISTAVVIYRGSNRVIFPVSRRRGHLSFMDNRETKTGIFYSAREGKNTGAGSKKSLTATAWIQEVARLIGRGRAEQLVQELR